MGVAFGGWNAMLDAGQEHALLSRAKLHGVPSAAVPASAAVPGAAISAAAMPARSVPQPLAGGFSPAFALGGGMGLPAGGQVPFASGFSTFLHPAPRPGQARSFASLDDVESPLAGCGLGLESSMGRWTDDRGSEEGGVAVEEDYNTWLNDDY